MPAQGMTNRVWTKGTCEGVGESTVAMEVGYDDNE